MYDTEDALQLVNDADAILPDVETARLRELIERDVVRPLRLGEALELEKRAAELRTRLAAGQ